MTEIESESYSSAHNEAERKKSNLAFAFFCMEPDRARDMEIFYSFCRLMDDIADDEGEAPEARRAKLEAWKNEIDRAYSDGKNLSPLGAEMRDLTTRRNIPRQYVLDIIDGVMLDTAPQHFETFDDVRKYCYGVASAVGLVSIYIFGFKNPRTKLFAESLGYALQFTNILRDVVDDARTLGRIYIPAREMRHFGVDKNDLLDPAKNPACKRLFRLMHFRAKHFFNKSRRLLAPEDKRALAPALIMWRIYEKILDRLAARDFDIPPKPLKISKPEKILLAIRALRESKRPSSNDRQSGKVCIAGGGAAGICAALRAASKGYDAELFEARPALGGRAAGIAWNGARLDNGTHALMGCYKNLFGYLDLLGSGGADFFRPVDSMLFLSPDGKNLKVDFPKKSDGFFKRLFSALRFVKLEGFFSLGNLRVLLGLKTSLTNPRAGETAADFLSRYGVPQTVLDNFWEPFCVSALNTSLKNALARLMCETLKKSILAGGDSALLYLPVRPIADALADASIYIESVGGKILLNEKVENVEFDAEGVTARTSKGNFTRADYFISALPPRQLAALLPNSTLKDKIGNVKSNAILNVYFTTGRKLFDASYACLTHSAIHWIFDHSPKLPASDKPAKFLYGITVSASETVLAKDATERLIKNELAKFFGEFAVEEILPMRFADAALACTLESDAARPAESDAAEISPRFRMCGDWIQTNLPATLESAALSAENLKL